MHSQKFQSHRSPFTLIEIMVAMLILSILLLLLMRILVTSQSIWLRNTTDAQVFENAWVALDVIERDVRSMVASSLPKREIGFYLAENDITDEAKSLSACIVSAIEPPIKANSQLCEISYFFHKDPKAPSTRHRLMRQIITDDNANWNFFGAPADWYLNGASSELLVSGVDDFRILFYDALGNIIPYDTEEFSLPSRVEIFLLLFDEAAIDLPPEKRQETFRGFTRVIDLKDVDH